MSFCGDPRRFLIGEALFFGNGGERDSRDDFEGGEKSLGERFFISASARVSGRAGDGERLETGDLTTFAASIGDFERDFSSESRELIDLTFLGGSLGKAMSKRLPLSSRFSTLIFVGLITFFPKVSRALAARPVCKRFRVFISRCRSSSSSCCCFGSSSIISASSSLDERRLTRGATTLIFLLREIERDLGLGLARRSSSSRRFVDDFFRTCSSCRISR